MYVFTAPLMPPWASQPTQRQTPHTHTPTTPWQRRVGSPHSGRHSTSRIDGPAGNKWCHTANNVWPFYEQTSAPFLQVSQSAMYTYLALLTEWLRSSCSAGWPCGGRYTKKTSTGTLCSHLANDHRDEWISSCDRAGITIKSQSVQGIVEAYCNEHGEEFNRTQEGSWPSFSREAFVNAIVAFIIADDQVSWLIISLKPILTILCP